MLNTTSKFLETFTHGLVGARQEWYHMCLFTFHDLFFSFIIPVTYLLAYLFGQYNRKCFLPSLSNCMALQQTTLYNT